LQAGFLVSFVLLAPWVGPFADARPKATVLTLANWVKMLGGLLMLTGIDPFTSYAVIGIGAAMYSPAKYGILPELVGHDRLVRANGWIEGSTILAILTGMAVGAWVADRSIDAALGMVVGLYLVSGLAAMLIRKIPPLHPPADAAIPHFLKMTVSFMSTSRARFAVLGASLFWGSAAALRVIVVVWAPAVLLLTNTFDISKLTLASALGIAIGALIAPTLIPLEHLRRARIAAYLMGVSIIALSLLDGIWSARIALFAAGIAGGIFVVPINAALQEIGHKTVGSGGAVAVQHFFENIAMLAATGAYALAADRGIGPAASLAGLGVLVLIAGFGVSRHLPANGTVPKTGG
jgi:LPLT family lysophospholipid transporter-like MFS transporter